MKRKIVYRGSLDQIYDEIVRMEDHHRDKEFAESRISEIPIILNTTESEGEWGE